MGNEYLAVVKAAYDYAPQSEDEVAIKENQLLFLLDKSDDDWWKVRVKTESQDDEGPSGLVPSAYVESADHTSVVKALYDYEATAPGELTIKEDDILHVFDKEDEWLLVQQQKAGGKAGFVPANYVEEADGSRGAASAPVAATSLSSIVVPDSPPRPAYKDPETLVASNKASADEIQTWAVTEIDKKGKKKKGTLGVGNGAVFFASESDKTPVQQWKMSDVESFKIDKGKHILLDIGGATPANLHFSAGAKDTAEEIHAKLASSHALAVPGRAAAAGSPESDHPVDAKKKNGASVHFSPASPQYIPARTPSVDTLDDVPSPAPPAPAPSAGGGGEAVALYDFVADGEDELSISEGEKLTVLEKDGDDWWKVRNSRRQEGVVPASYVELPAGSGSAPANMSRVESDSDGEEERLATQRAEDDARRKREEEERERTERERARKEKDRAERERRKREDEEKQREDEERERDRERERKRREKDERRAARAAEEEAEEKRRSQDARRAEEEKKRRDSKRDSKRGPPPERTREWRDRTGQFRVEAALLGYADGKLKLHKVNGVIIEVPSEKMSAEDLDYVKKFYSKKPSPSSPSTPTPSASRPSADDDNVPLAVRRKSLAPQKKGPATDWFEFFLAAGCDIDDCTRYAQSFERDKIDESILPDITESTMRSLGLREGDIIRVKKQIEVRKPKKEPTKDDTDQIKKDEELARKLQNGDDVKPRTTSPAPNLFAAPDGTLKDNTKRRGRPQPSKSLPPANVDLISLNTSGASESAKASPALVASPTGIASPPPRAASATPSGFDDDAWTNRPSSTQPIAPTPPAIAPSPAALTPRAPSAPPAPAPPPQTVPSISEPLRAQPTGLAQTTESDVFNQLARLSQLRTQSPAIQPPQSAPPTLPQNTMSPPPASFHAGMGLGNSSLPIGQHLQAQQTGMYQPQQQNGPRGPYAPVLQNQSLLAPLVPTSTGFNNFVPTRPQSTPSQFQTPQPPLQFMPPQQQQQMGFNPGQGAGFGGPLMSQPTGFPGPVMSQSTGMPGGGFGGNAMGGQLMAQPTGFGGNNMFAPNAGGYGGVQTNPTGFNPGFGQFNGGMTSPPPQSAQKDVTPANIFAQMKSGTFGNDDAPQPQEKYDALRPQPTGWGGFQQPMNTFQTGYGGYQR